MTTIKLGEPQPCPFCGGKAQLKEKSEAWGYTPAAVAYGCNACDYHLPFISHSEMAQDDYPSKGGALLQAITAWNTRGGKRPKVEVEEA